MPGPGVVTAVADEPSTTPSDGSFRTVFEIVSSVLAPVTVVTALLYYFGWVRTGALFGYFGIDQGVLGFSTQDYLLRSAGVAFRPALILFLILAGVTIGQALIFRLARQILGGGTKGHWWLQWLVIGLPLALLVLPALSLLGLGPPMAGAVGLGLAGLLAAYLAFLHGDALVRDALYGARSTEVGSPPQLRMARVGLALFGVLLSLFWATSIYAQNSGRVLAEYIDRYPGSRPAAVIYTAKRLQISGPGVRVQDLKEDSLANYRFRYSGLRLLIYSGDRWIVFPEGWSRDNQASLILLTDDGTIRVELHP